MRQSYLFFLAAAALIAAITAGCEDASLGPAQRGDIAGQVLDFETNDPLAGVNITTSPPTSSLVTDAEGRFTLQNVEAGNYTVNATKSGYAPNQITVAVRADETTPATLFLEPSTTETATDSIAVSVVNWANRAMQPDSVFVDVEYRVQNVGTTEIDRYEVYFRIQTDAEDFYYEARGDSLAVDQADIGQFSKYLRAHTASEVLIDNFWLE